ncbi:hypothetical protein ACJJTC_006805 [Scirpophaga incertulas]
MGETIITMSKKVESEGKYEADLEQALAVVGIGPYNLKICFVLSLFLVAAIIESIGYSYLLPSSKCDLNMTDFHRGLISSIPFFATVLTSFAWGYLVDTRGRKWILIYSSVAAGLLGLLAGFMPELVSFTVCKFLASLCLACPSAVPYTFIGEVLPQRYRDITLSVTNSMQILGSAFIPLLAWAILPLDFRVDFGYYEFRSWRLLCVAYAALFLVAAVLISFAPESPKYLVSQGKHDEALDVLKIMYARNKQRSPDDFPINALRMPVIGQNKLSFLTSLKAQTMPLVVPPYLKWIALNGFLLFGIFGVLNGLYMWVPDVLNRVLSTAGGEDMTACDIIRLRANNTMPKAVCDDTIDPLTYTVGSVATISCALIALVVSTFVKLIGKKALLIVIFVIMSLFCIFINLTTKQMLFAVLLSALPITGLCIGPVNAYSVEIFPTQMRGMAVGLTMMIARLGSIVSTNVTGLMINSACEEMFYTYGGMLMLLGALSLLLPRSQSRTQKSEESNSTHL